MPATVPAGPYRVVSAGGQEAPMYVIPYDKDGNCDAPGTAEHFLQASRGDQPTDVYLFAHGWNNDWSDATGLYDRFADSYLTLVRKRGRPRPGARAVLAGISWPSIALSGDRAPQMAAGDGSAGDDLAGAADLAEEFVPTADRPAFHELIQRPALDRGQAAELADLLAPLYGAAGADDLDGDRVGESEDLVALWSDLSAPAATYYELVSGPGRPPAPAATQGAGPAAAGLLDLFDPRWIVRLATVLQMKDRGGRVGARGVHDLLASLLTEAPNARIHLLGHSYGCKVVLSALCARTLPRPVRSVLLLQPALSYLALADQLPGTDRSGGYRAAKGRSELPILTTFTRRDLPLRTVFHLAVRRRSDVGEQDIGAAGIERPPSRYAAMGGWGPGGLGSQLRAVPMLAPAEGGYDLQAGNRVLALEAHDLIGGHSAIVSDATAWVLYQLVSAAGPDHG